MLSGHEMPGARWFEGAEINYAEAVFRRATADRPALAFQSERDPLRLVEWAELERSVAAAAAGLRRLGVGRGDRVVAVIPNIPEAVVAFLACASIGAIWASCSPDFGTRSLIDRFAQISPKVLIAVDGYTYGGKRFDRRDVIEAIRAELPSLERTVLVPYLDADVRGPARRAAVGRPPRRPSRAAAASSPSRSTTRCGSSTRRARPGCPRRSSTATAGSSSSTPRSSASTATSASATGCSGSRPPAG